LYKIKEYSEECPMKTLIIIPAYNEEGSLPALLKRIFEVDPLLDVVVINDCSTDHTAEICNSLGVRIINLPVNLGIGGAVQTGYKYAYYNGYDIAVQLDADGQHDPSYIKMLTEKIEKGCDLCIGSRFINNEGFQSTRARRLGIAYFSRLIKLFTGQYVSDPTSGFRACSKRTIGLFSRDYPRDYPEPESVVNVKRNHLKICEIPVVMNARESGNSSITSLKSIYYMIKVSLAIIIASFSKGGKN
jgi:glycosyltransferase involved in cell wall biosynthesis